MRRILICAVAAAASWLAPLGARTPLAQSVAAAVATDAPARVIVKFRADSPLLRKQALSAAGQQTLQAAGLGQRIGVALDSGRGLSERSHVVIGHGLTSKQLAARIAAEGDVEYAVADERKHILEVPNDPLYARRDDGAGARPGGRPVVSAAARPRGERLRARRRRRSTPSRRGTSPRATSASSSPCSTPASASTTRISRAATSCPATT